MAEPWGEILYRAAAAIAGMVALLALLNFIYNVSEGEPMIPVVALGLAAINMANRALLPLRSRCSLKEH